jgi:hypothetical protein
MYIVHCHSYGYVVIARYRWDDKKNKELIAKGRPGFEEAVEALANNSLLMDDVNPIHICRDQQLPTCHSI